MKYIKKYFTIWWIPIIFYIIPFVTYFIGHILGNNNVIRYSLHIFLINVLGNVISVIVQVVHKNWYFTIPQILFSAFLFYYATKVFTYGELDFFSGYKIPEDIKCEELSHREIQNSELNSNDFKLKGCCGYHTYYASFQPKEKGYLYIKAYEITSNDRLSEEYLNESSKIMIKDLKQKFYSGTFTIYEGDSRDKYCARIELWFQPNNGKEYKVNQKNYIVEGKD